MKKIILIAAAVTFTAALSASAANGKALWTKEHCAMCHGMDGKGHTPMGKRMGIKDFTNAKVQKALKDDAAFKAIKDGFRSKGRRVMRPYSNLSDAQIKALVKYVRSFKK